MSGASIRGVPAGLLRLGPAHRCGESRGLGSRAEAHFLTDDEIDLLVVKMGLKD